MKCLAINVPLRLHPVGGRISVVSATIKSHNYNKIKYFRSSRDVFLLTLLISSDNICEEQEGCQ